MSQSITTVSVLGDFTRTIDASSRVEGALAAETSLDSAGRYTPGITVSYASRNPDLGETISDVIVAPGISLAITARTDAVVDYTFDNKVDSEDSFSITVAHLISSPEDPLATRLTFKVAKHGVVVFGVSLTQDLIRRRTAGN